jgi:hypothetical protein
VRSAAPRLSFSPSLLLSLLLTFTFTLTFTSTARAQWQTTTYTLQGGWNAIYLHGDASHVTPDVLFAANPEVLSVWRWNPNPTQTQFTNSPLIPSVGAVEWSVWNRGSPSTSTLASLPGQHAYLVQCAGTVADTYFVSLTQKTLPPRSTWVRNGANLLGFPTRQTNSTFPTFSAYFATFPAALAANSRVYTYAGGDLGAANPVQVFAPAGTPLDRTKAYWFEAPVVGNFYAPLEITPSQPDGLHFGRTGSLFTVRVRNRTAAPVTITVAPLNSVGAPVGQPQITGPVPLTRRTVNATTGATTETLLTGTFNEVIGPQSTVELSFGLQRAAMTGPGGALYASFLRFTDGGNLLDISLSASATVASLAGLWIGDIAVTDVGNQTRSFYHTCEVTRTVGTVVTTLTSAAVQGSPTALRPLQLPAGTGGTLTYRWLKDNQPIADATAALLELTAPERVASGAFGTTTVRAFPLRVLLHVDDAGTARLLSQVFVGSLAPSPHNLGLCTRETGLKSDAKATATRYVSTQLPLDTEVATGTGTVALGGTLVRTFTLGFNDRTNPFVHAYHPDHDNRDARGNPLPAGVESYTVTRECTFDFAATPPAGTATVGWGASVIGGTYRETVTGLHRNPLTVTGTFELRRASELGSLTLN